MDIHVELPSLAAVTAVYFSDAPTVGRAFGKVNLQGFQYHAENNASIDIITETGITDAHVVRDIYVAMDRAVENFTFVVRGFNSTAKEGSGIGAPPSLLEKLLVHLEYRYEMTPADYNPEQSTTTATETEKKSLLSITATSEGTTSTTLNVQYDMHAQDVPEWLPFVASDSMALIVSSSASESGNGNSALSITINAFQINATTGSLFEMTIVSTGTAQLAATRDIVSALRHPDTTTNVHVIGNVGSNSNGISIKAKIGQTDFASLREKVGNKTSVEIQTVNLVGGNGIGSAVRIPCIMDTVCPGIMHSEDETTAFTFFVEYTLEIEGLPCHLYINVNGISLSLADNTHTKFIKLNLANAYVFDTRITSTVVQSVRKYKSEREQASRIWKSTVDLHFYSFLPLPNLISLSLLRFSFYI